VEDREKIKILEHNVSDLQKQLYKSYNNIAELTKQNRSLTQQRNELMHHQLAESEVLLKDDNNKDGLTTYVEDAMNLNIEAFQNILDKLKGV
jgi:predicted transcriptional regulator|tara:strand:- start:1445 stop:1720 length:276 start_codon:yes stop_codon:yes gene_type:complete